MRLPLLASPRTESHRSTAPKPPPAPPTLPRFTTANGELHGSTSPRRERSLGPEQALATPIDQAIDAIRDLTARIQASFDRMRLTEAAFAHESRALQSSVARIQHEQELVARAYLALFHASATHIQRAFRGFQTRRDYREALALRAVLRIQRAFRAKQSRRAQRRRQFRILSKKVLRGMKGVCERHDLSHNELLNRVSHNMTIERQWRMAMGVADTENDLLHALYRRKFVRQRVATLFQNVRIMAAVTGFWQRLVPQRPVEAAEQPADAAMEDAVDPVDLSLDLDNNLEREPSPPSVPAALTTAKPPLYALTQQLASPSRHAKSTSKPTSGVSREDLRRKQKLYTQRVYEENLKKEAVRAVQIEKQRELVRLSEEARKLEEDEQRRLRLEQAQALREDLERRGLLAIKELQSKKEQELRKEEAAQQRVAQARQKIAKEVLSGETQVLLTRKHLGQASVPKPTV